MGRLRSARRTAVAAAPTLIPGESTPKVKSSGRSAPSTRATCASRSQGIGRDQAAIEIEIIVNHALGCVAFASAGVGELGVGSAQGAVGLEAAKSFGEAMGVVGAEVEGGVSPHFTETGNIVGYDCTTGEGGVQRCYAERFVARRGGVDGGAAVESAQLSFGLRTANSDAALSSGDLHIGADGDTGHGHSLLSAHNAYRERLRMLRQEENLLASIEQAADGEHGIVFGDVGIEEDGIASRINYGGTARPLVGRDKSIGHAGRGRDYGVGSGNAADESFAVPP